MSVAATEAIIALIQAIVSYMKASGLADEEIDAVMAEGRKGNQERPISDLPRPGGA